MTKPLLQYRQESSVYLLFYLATFIVTSSAGLKISTSGREELSAGGYVLPIIISVSAGLGLVLFLARVLKPESFDKDSRPGLAIWQDAIVKNPDRTAERFLIEEISHLELDESDEASDSLWLVLKSLDQVQVPLPPIDRLEAACDQVGLIIIRRNQFGRSWRQASD